MSRLAERSIIGALLMDINSINTVYDELRPEMFREELYQKVYIEIVRMYDTGERINLVSLSQRLQGYGYPENIILDGLRECINSTMTTTEIRSYADVLTSNYKAAQLLAILNSVKVLPVDIENQIGLLMNDLEALKSSEHTKLRSMVQIVAEHERSHFAEHESNGINLGFPRLDDMLVELEKGDITVIGARPAVGKSAFVTQIIRSLSTSGKRGAFYNLEMSDKQIYERMLSSETGIGLKRIRKAQAYIGDEQPKVSAANSKISQYQVMVRSGSVKPTDIRNECRHLDLDYIVIDYLQLMKSDTWYSNRASEVGAVSKAIKSLAMELQVHIILLSQLNRVSEGRDTKEPSMAEIRESGDVEQDASAIILLWNTDPDDISQKGIKVEKNRQGELGKIPFGFDGATMQFVEREGTIIMQQEGFKRTKKTPFDD
ncbi:replicative DNA helicase [Lacrimispora indolis]|uniref:replicative DNA helicase n=1 Tax=Lacrimispora indolis TaxID=69825 RepID=UPI00045EAFBD|nr:DnaB-like helicase C-terminal domain-containing protein [Lacrimispora indolis]